MTETTDCYDDPNTLFGRLRSACVNEWSAYCNHEFVRRIGDASLSQKRFRHYLEQDYLFLIRFAWAFALAALKAERVADIRAATASLDSILNHEMGLHVEYCGDGD